jgi:hypothetical protein
MTLALQPILEKGIVDHSIIHRAIVEYLSISKKVRNVSVIFVLDMGCSGELFILWHSKFWGFNSLALAWSAEHDTGSSAAALRCTSGPHAPHP